MRHGSFLRFAIALPLVAATATAQVADPFAPQTRWVASPSASAAWMPASVDFAAGGELVFAAGALANPSWLVFSTPLPADASGHVQPLLAASAAPGTLSNMIVRCGPRANELFTLAQVPDPDASHRRTEVARFDALAGGALACAWTHDLGLRVNGGAKLAVSDDGARVVALVHDATTQQLRLEWIDGATGALLSRVDWNAGTLRQLAASADLQSVAVVAGLELFVFDAAGALRHHENLSASTQALALSGDGTTLVVGAPGLVRVLAWNSGAFVERAREIAPAALLPARCAIAHDGATWAAGWWNASTGRDVRLELRGAPNDSLIWETLQSAASPAPQNYPEAVCIARDGRRAVFGVWGSADAQPEVVLVDRDLGGAVATLDLAGSVLALALDASGTRLAIGMKHAHANQFATSGEVRLFDTGERDVQALDQARLGTPLSVAARRGGAKTVWFLHGPRSAAPLPLSNVSGSLWLRRRTMRAVRAPADATGRATASLPVPWTPAGAGVPFSVQALFRSRGSDSLSGTVLDPVAF